MKKILTFFVAALFLIAVSPEISNAGLWDYFNERGQALPSVTERIESAQRCGIDNYSGTAEQNEILETCLSNNNSNVDYWVNFLQNYDPASMDLTDEQLANIPEEAWYRITPQIYNQIDKTSDDLLGGQRILDVSLCRGDECVRYQTNELGLAVVTRYRTRLASSMTSTQATVPVSSVTSFDGTTLTMALLDDLVFLTIEPGTSREEITKCTSLSSTTWGTCTRGLAFTGKVETAVTANQKAHNAGSVVVMSNVHFVFNQLADLDTAETFAGLKTFSVYPESGVGADATTSDQFLTLGQAQALTNQGAATSTDAVAGICELSTQIENASSTPFGINDPRCIQSQHASSTPSAGDSGLYVIVSENDGKINQNWSDLTEQWNFTTAKITTTSSTNATSTELVVGSTNPTDDSALTVNGGIAFDNASSTNTFNAGGDVCYGTADCMNSHWIDLTNHTTYRGFIGMSTSNWAQNDATCTITDGGNYVTITAGDTTASCESQLFGTAGDVVYQFDGGQSITLQWQAKHNDTTGTKQMGIMSTNDSALIGACTADTANSAFLGFCSDGTTLNARAQLNNTETLTAITAPTLDSWNTYAIEWNPDTPEAKFYLNGNLEATLTTTTPTTLAEGASFMLGLSDNADTITVSAIKYELEL